VPVRISGASAAAGSVMGLTVDQCDPANPDRISAGFLLEPGPHVLTTARGKDVGWSIDRVAMVSGLSTGAIARDGRVADLGRASAPAHVDVVKNGRTSLRVHVTGATEPFWMVLGESQSKGWHAHVECERSAATKSAPSEPCSGDKGLGDSHLVDGYANGWLVHPTSASFDIAMEWTPQKQVDAALWISLLAAIASIGIIALTSRRRAVGAPAADAAVDVTLMPRGAIPTRVRWVAPVLAGLLAALAVAPWVGLLVGALVALMVWRPRSRVVVMALPAVLLAGGGLYIAAQQWRYKYPSIFEWPTVFARVRTPAWIAVMLLAGDVIVEIIRSRTRDPSPGDARRS
jgi:hypothetical protein